MAYGYGEGLWSPGHGEGVWSILSLLVLPLLILISLLLLAILESEQKAWGLEGKSRNPVFN